MLSGFFAAQRVQFMPKLFHPGTRRRVARREAANKAVGFRVVERDGVGRFSVARFGFVEARVPVRPLGQLAARARISSMAFCRRSGVFRPRKSNFTSPRGLDPFHVETEVAGIVGTAEKSLVNYSRGTPARSRRAVADHHRRAAWVEDTCAATPRSSRRRFHQVGGWGGWTLAVRRLYLARLSRISSRVSPRLRP